MFFTDNEVKKWRNLALIVTGAGVLVMAAPWPTNMVRFYAALPIYMVFVYVYYKYICLRKASREEGSVGSPSAAAKRAEPDKGKKPKRPKG